MYLFSSFVPGDPVGKQAPQRSRFGVFTPAKTRRWEAGLVKAFSNDKKGETIDFPVFLYTSIFICRPSSKRGCFCSVKPDYDNVLKSVGDSLQKALVLKNDSRITGALAFKEYGDPGISVILVKAEDASCLIKQILTDRSKRFI